MASCKNTNIIYPIYIRKSEDLLDTRHKSALLRLAPGGALLRLAPFGDLSLEQQIQLFSQTTHLLSIHSAGLSNLVFMPPKSKIIEIRHKELNQMLNCFYTLSHTFDMEYYYVFGNNKGDTLPNENRPEDKSIHVNVEMLKSVLNCI